MKFSFAAVYSIYCGLLFANLCLPDPDSWTDRWKWGDLIKCPKQDEYDATEHYFNQKQLKDFIFICWILLIISSIVDIISEVFSLITTKCLKPKESLSKRLSTWILILADVAIIAVLVTGEYNNVACLITVII